jgi:hypothetical protein
MDVKWFMLIFFGALILQDINVKLVMAITYLTFIRSHFLCSRIQVKGFFQGHEHSGRNVLKKYCCDKYIDLRNLIAFTVPTHECCMSLTAC